ncbi:hypothetical protein HK102_013824 [Quaeritorhiza haematococci]|nr:hypothetical protein HK102_013824 [Quaeritorhiza haematococci]
MLTFTALWHTFNREPSVASWLLCEANALTPTGPEQDQITRFKNNVMMQLMINKHFKVDVGQYVFDLREFGNYGLALTHSSIYTKDYYIRKELPGLAITADVAKLPPTSDSKSPNGPAKPNPMKSKSKAKGSKAPPGPPKAPSTAESMATLKEQINLRICAICGTHTSNDIMAATFDLASPESIEFFRGILDAKIPLDNVFLHSHSLGSCDGFATFALMSTFKVKPHITRKGPERGCLVELLIRAHDNFREQIFLTNNWDSILRCKETLQNNLRSDGTMSFVQISYATAQRLVADCLKRMVGAGKTISKKSKELKLIIDLYGCENVSSSPEPQLPPPAPAPSVPELWLLLNRPEYYYWCFFEELIPHIRQGLRPSEQLLNRALDILSKDAYFRRRVYGMLTHMALWHTFNQEPSIASWLLCEASVLTPIGTEEDQISRFRKSVVVQLMINKHFHLGVGHEVLDFGSLGNYGRGLTNFSIYSKDLFLRKDLPGLAVTTTIATLPPTTTPDFTNPLAIPNTPPNPNGCKPPTTAESIAILKKEIKFRACAHLDFDCDSMASKPKAKGADKPDNEQFAPAATPQMLAFFRKVLEYKIPLEHPSIFTKLELRAHDDFRDAHVSSNTWKGIASYRDELMEWTKDNGNMQFVEVPYATCRTLVANCLKRTVEAGKTTSKKSTHLQFIIDLYSYENVGPTLLELSLPPLAPAPSVSNLWLLVNRPEYFFWSFAEDNGLKIADTLDLPPSEKLLNEQLDLLSKDPYIRRRVYGMLTHNALWHTFNEEPKVAAWLLCEASVLAPTGSEKRQVERFKKSVVVQLLVNKLFMIDLVSNLWTFHCNIYSLACTRLLQYRDDRRVRGGLPGLALTASVAELSDAAGGDDSTSGLTADTTAESIEILKKELKLRACAFCGVKRPRLKRCARCMSVSYCSAEHQKLHWKNGQQDRMLGGCK